MTDWLAAALALEDNAYHAVVYLAGIPMWMLACLAWYRIGFRRGQRTITRRRDQHGR